MAIHTLVYRALLMMALLALAAGCSDPDANPVVAPPPLRDGDALDLNATHIGANGGRPWIVNTDWVIEAGRTVTIDADAEIMFAGQHSVIVDGKIVANGAADHPVTFTTAFLNAERGQWGNVRLHNGSEPSEFRYCIFSYGAHFVDDTSSDVSKYYRGMISARNSSPLLENCLIILNQDNGVYVHQDAGSASACPQVRYSVITLNDGSAVRTNINVDMSCVDISHNSVGGNTITIPFLLAQTDSSYGFQRTVNANLDSTDLHFNLLENHLPELEDAEGGNYTLTSCSPAVDAGPEGITDPDGTRRDLGAHPYHQVQDELRGVISGVLNAGATYRMSCHVRVPQNGTLTIPAGTRIEATGLYNLEVFGRLEILGTPTDRVEICNCLVAGQDVWGGVRFFNYDSLSPSAPSVVQYANFLNYERLDIDKPGITFEGVRFSGGYLYGAKIATGSIELADSVSFRYCEFDDCGQYGIQSDTSALMIRNSIVQNVKGRGISVSRTGSSVEITNTVVRACSTSGIRAAELTNPLIVNCVLTNNGYHGLNLVNNSNAIVLNTIIWANRRMGIRAELSSVPQLGYNNIEGNPDANYEPSWLQGACVGCIAADPLLSGATGAALGVGSPSIDAGHPDSQYNDTDLTRNDQGAYGGPQGGLPGAAGVSGSNYTVVLR